MKKILLINRKAFLNWYFDHDMIKDFFYTHSILDSLKRKGKFTITADELLYNIGYLPEQVIESGQDPILNDSEEVEMSEYDEIKFS